MVILLAKDMIQHNYKCRRTSTGIGSRDSVIVPDMYSGKWYLIVIILIDCHQYHKVCFRRLWSLMWTETLLSSAFLAFNLALSFCPSDTLTHPTQHNIQVWKVILLRRNPSGLVFIHYLYVALILRFLSFVSD